MIDLNKEILGIQYEQETHQLDIDAELEPLLKKLSEAIENFLSEGVEL